MMLIAIVVALVTLALAAVHAYWGFGGIWPGIDAASLAATVVGSKGATEMPPPAACFIVAIVLCFTSLVALVLGGIVPSPLPFFLLGPAALVTTLVFIGRGIAGYTHAWRRQKPAQPFARLDRLYYSPLCLLLGAGFFTLGIRGFSA